MTYVYDANGNIVSKTPYTNVTSSDLSTATQGTAIVYGYGDSNWSDKLTSYDGQTISYDASGNPTSYRGETATWNGRFMTSYTKDDRRYEYSYNSDGMRTVKRVYEDDELVYTYTYIWDGDVLLGGRMEVPDNDESITIRYLYDENGELYGMDYNGNGYFAFIKNLQGDIVSIVPLDPESNVEIDMEYDAWGKPIIEQASSLAEGFMMAVLMAVTNVGYCGYFYDFETGLYYLRSRYYDPETGRFINADDTDYLGYDDSPLSTNLFAYCKNNPVYNSDKTGNSSEKIVQITVNFYNLNSLSPHCDITYDHTTVSYGSDNGYGTAKMSLKVIGTQGYILIKNADKSYDAKDFRTIKVKVYYNYFLDFFIEEINKTMYFGKRKKSTATLPSSVFMPFYSTDPTRSSKYYLYRIGKTTCVTFASDWLYYSMYLPSKKLLKNGGRDLKKFTLPKQLYNYLEPLR